MTEAKGAAKGKADDQVLKINAPTFVPGTSSNHSKAAVASVSISQSKNGSGLAVKAAPFVPGGE